MDYKVIVFDLDDTLIDNNENIKCAFREVLNSRNEKWNNDIFKKFAIHDKNYWARRAKNEKLKKEKFESNEKKAEHARAHRFMEFFEDLEYQDAVKINNIYMEALKENIVMIDGAKNILSYLKSKNYIIVVATNGPTVAINSKLKKPGLYEYVDVIFSADEVGSMKPNKEFFDGMIDKINRKLKINVRKNEMILIGDEIDKDLKGGNDNDIDVCLFKNLKTSMIYDEQYIKTLNPKYEINSLTELKNIL